VKFKGELYINFSVIFYFDEGIKENWGFMARGYFGVGVIFGLVSGLGRLLRGNFDG
jgi:hypothetical protein